MTKIKRRATRLREKVLTYNLVTAFQLAKQGSRPFPPTIITVFNPSNMAPLNQLPQP